MNSKEFLDIAERHAMEQSRIHPNSLLLLYWDGIDEYGVVPEANKEKFLSIYPTATLISSFCNGKKV